MFQKNFKSCLDPPSYKVHWGEASENGFWGGKKKLLSESEFDRLYDSLHHGFRGPLSDRCYDKDGQFQLEPEFHSDYCKFDVYFSDTDTVVMGDTGENVLCDCDCGFPSNMCDGVPDTFVDIF